MRYGSSCNLAGRSNHPQTHSDLKPSSSARSRVKGRRWAQEAPDTGASVCSTESLACGRATAEEHAVGRAGRCYQKAHRSPGLQAFTRGSARKGEQQGFAPGARRAGETAPCDGLSSPQSHTRKLRHRAELADAAMEPKPAGSRVFVQLHHGLV